MSKQDVSEVGVLSFSISEAEDLGGINGVFWGMSEPDVPELFFSLSDPETRL